MSARSIIVLALVATVTVVQATSFPYNVKGGQSFVQEAPLKGQHLQQHQQVEAPLAPAVQSYESPVKGVYQGQQTQWQQRLPQAQHQQMEYVAPGAVQGQAAYEAPVKGAQSFYQEPLKGQFVQSTRQPVVAESFKSAQPVVAQTVQQHQQVEAPLQAPVTAQSYEAPVKGAQSFYQEPLKGQFAQQPLRQPVQQTVQSQHQQVEAPVQAPVATQAYEAPVKGSQSFYQEPLKGQFAQQPLRQPVVQQVGQAAHVEMAAPVKGQNYFGLPRSSSKL